MPKPNDDAARPGAAGLFLWAALIAIIPFPVLGGTGHPLLIGPDGKARPWLNADVLPTEGYSLLGFDERHRAIVSVRSDDRRRFTVAALDVDTGAVSTIYP